ncbi:MAG: hypothetical protein JWM32_838 [Verrucomicrobia bacterium]|nr:hypothetical protein [Verrucomicrobiota bacterium]
MKPLRFFSWVVGAVAGLGALYIAAFIFALRQPVWPYHWLRDVYLVKDQLAARSQGPRCLILGGSSAWFGLQSGPIERALGQQVINLGTHAEVPLKVQLWQAERYLRAGDTLILAEELGQYGPRDHTYTTYAATEVALMAPGFWRQASWRDKLDLLRSVPPARVATGLMSWLNRGSAAYRERMALPSTATLMENLQAKWAGAYAKKMPPHYSYLELDDHGDMMRMRETAAHGHEDYGLSKAPEEAPEVWRQLSAFSGLMRARGVRCLFIWPPFERHGGVHLDSAPAKANFDFLRAHLAAAGWRVVGEPEDGALGSQYFYDTAFHLTTEGARLHTVHVVERLRAAGLARP